ncbi:MAG: hypothetical protein KF795_14430 [Labilithrix sp.]|nr:hypothetical protein [Labilithrix sp.]
MLLALVLVLIVAAFAAGFTLARRRAFPRAPGVAASPVALVAASDAGAPAVAASPIASVAEASPIASVVEASPIASAVAASPVAAVAASPVAAVAASPVAIPRAPSIRFEPVAPRGTQSLELEEHAPEWRAAMAAVGERFAASDVVAVVFVHGTFAGTDPLSAYGVVQRALPRGIGPYVARRLKKKTRGYLGRVLGDLGNFGAAYVRLFEEAIRPRGARIPCTDFVWSSENHHVGRLEGALGLVRVLATHAELAGRDAVARQGRVRRILVIGHSHAGQLFALVTQLFARSIATDAILDVARARELDVASLEADLTTLLGAPDERRAPRVAVDFVTFGAPSRYAWATIPSVRALHVVAVPSGAGRGGAAEADWIRRLAVEGSDFPPLGVEDRRINAALAASLGHGGFAPARVASALWAEAGLPTNGDVAFVEYGDRGLFASGLGHGSYTRLDAMLFHARLVAERLYPAPRAIADVTSPRSRGWSLRALGSRPKPSPP